MVTVPARAAGADKLWHRFASATGLAEVEDLDLGVERANESLGVVEAELLRRVNGGIDGRIPGGRQKSLWMRDLLAHTILAPIGREPIGLTEAHAEEARPRPRRRSPPSPRPATSSTATSRTCAPLPSRPGCRGR